MTRGGHPRWARRLVLVSADGELARAISDGLARFGIPSSALVTICSGAEALRWVAAERPALVVLDDAAADCAGAELVTALAREGVDCARVIYVATRHTFELERLVRRLGVLYYTEKPPACGVIERIAASVIGSEDGSVSSGREPSSRRAHPGRTW